MASANAGLVVAQAWEDAISKADELSRYGDGPLTVGWWRGMAFVRIWDFRSGWETWKRLPSYDAREPKVKPPKRGMFSSRFLFDRLAREAAK